MPGPAPKPTALVVLEGNRGHRNLSVRANEPKPEVVAPKCPAHLDQIAKREWKRLLPILLRMRVLTEADGIALAALCQAYSRLITAEQALSKSGLLMKTSTGYIQQSPLIGIINSATETVTKLCREFGLSPASRTRIRTENEAANTDEDDLIR